VKFAPHCTGQGLRNLKLKTARSIEHGVIPPMREFL